MNLQFFDVVDIVEKIVISIRTFKNIYIIHSLLFAIIPFIPKIFEINPKKTTLPLAYFWLTPSTFRDQSAHQTNSNLM